MCGLEDCYIAADIAFFTIVVHLFSHPLHERAIKPGNITSLQMSIQNTVCLI